MPDEPIHQYMDDEIEFDEMVEFYDDLKPSIKTENVNRLH